MNDHKKLSLYFDALTLKLSLEEQIEAARFNQDKPQEARLEVALNAATSRYNRRKCWLPISVKPVQIISISSDSGGIFSQESKRFEKVISTGAKVRPEVKKRARRKSPELVN